MTILQRLVGALAICTLGIAAAFAVADDRPRPFRTGKELCTELAYEMRISVGYDLLTEEEAHSIIERCYESS